MSQDTKILEKSKLRSVSVEASQTQKYIMPKSGNEKKIAVPKYKFSYALDLIYRFYPTTTANPTNP